MAHVYIVGGEQKPDALAKDEWHRYRRGLVVRLDLETGDIDTCADHVSPADAVPDRDPSVLFKAATVRDGKLYACTQTEIVVYRLPDFERVHYLSLPCFNDVHHVLPIADDRWLVANTGLDMVVEVSPDGGLHRTWNVLGQEPWERFSRETDYRKVPTTKPHRSHPNHVFELRGELWVTRFEQRDAVCLTADGRIEVAIQRPHDGQVHGDSIYFTTVDGHLVIVDAGSLEVRRVVNLDRITGGIRKLGWCRGLHLLDERHVLVGFSRLRPTQWSDNLAWLKQGRQGLRWLAQHPARVVLVDLQCDEIVRQYAVERAEMGAIFSIHAA